MGRSSNKDKLVTILACLFLLQTIFIVVVYYLPSIKLTRPVGDIGGWWKWTSEEINSTEFWTGEKLQENSCKIPLMDPYNPDMLWFFEPHTVNCKKKDYYFRSDVEENTNQPIIIMKKKLAVELSCCYEPLRFTSTNFRSVTFKNDTCTTLTEERTAVAVDSQYIIVHCWKGPTTPNPMTSFPPKLHAILHRELLFYIPKPKFLPTKNAPHERLSVIVMGFDQISRLNFIRLMGNTFHYLKSGLGAIDLQGYNKVGDATLNNTLAFMTGYTFGEFKKNPKWWKAKRDDSKYNTFFDDGPWIWKNFSKRGYLTAYGDDYSSVFNYRFQGFRKQPTDYYLYPFINWYMKRWEKFGASYDCIGDEPSLHLLQDLTRKISRSLRDHPYFHFMWHSRIHEKAGYASVADKYTLSTLRYLEETGALNKSLVILVSDHGWRIGPIMQNEQARIENRMPFAFLLLPQWLRNGYPRAYANLVENQYRLTTPFDIYHTLLDVLNYKEELNDQTIENRQEKGSPDPKKHGMSLFLPISKERTCEQAGIDETWCACSNYTHLTNRSLGVQLAEFAVTTINSWLKPFKLCQQYKLDKILRAEVQVKPLVQSVMPSVSDLGSTQTFRMAFSVKSSWKHFFVNTSPQFEVTIFLDERHSKDDNERMRMSNEIFRLNEYGESSACINVYSLKKICTCKK